MKSRPTHHPMRTFIQKKKIYFSFSSWVSLASTTLFEVAELRYEAARKMQRKLNAAKRKPNTKVFYSPDCRSNIPYFPEGMFNIFVSFSDGTEKENSTVVSQPETTFFFAESHFGMESLFVCECEEVGLRYAA